MTHETGLIMTIVAGLVLAFIFGMVANRLRLPPLVGYLFAGILVGPHTPGFVADTELAPQLAEIGVILLMFGVGLHFSLKDLLSVRALAIPGALVQMAFATLLGLGLATLLGWGVGGGLIFGLALSVASTVVLLKTLQERRLIETERGRIAVGWLIVEDFAMVIALVLIPALAGVFGATAAVPNDPFVSLVERLLGGDVGLWGVLGITIVKLAAFVGVMLIVGRRVIPFILHYTAHTGNRELFRLAVLALALGVAAGAAYLFGVSLALGAFFAGMILSESELSHRAAQETLPLRDAFAVLFFVSVGMLFDPTIIVTSPWPLLATVLIIVIGKSVAAFMIVVAFKRPVSTALSISVSLAQIGEFSFILAALGVSLNLLPPEGRDLILGGAIISIILNPMLFFLIDFLRPRIEGRTTHRGGVVVEPGLAVAGPAVETVAVPGRQQVHDADDEMPEPTRLKHHTILIGYGRVGRVVAEGLTAARAPFLVIEDADSRIVAARQAGLEVVTGNAASNAVLNLANIATANNLLIAISNTFEAGNAVEQARKLNPGIRIFARAHSEEEEEHLRHLGADTVVMGEREIGLGMLRLLLRQGPAAMAPADAPSRQTTRLKPAESFVAAAVPLAAAVVATRELDTEQPDTVEPDREEPGTAEFDTVSDANFTEDTGTDEFGLDLEGIGLSPVADAVAEPVTVQSSAPELLALVAEMVPTRPSGIGAAPLGEAGIAPTSPAANATSELTPTSSAAVNLAYLDAWDETPDEVAAAIPDVLPPVGPLSSPDYAPSRMPDERPESEVAALPANDPEAPEPVVAEAVDAIGVEAMVIESVVIEPVVTEPVLVEQGVVEPRLVALPVIEPMDAGEVTIEPALDEPVVAELEVNEPVVDAPVIEVPAHDETPVDAPAPEPEGSQSGASLPPPPEPETAALPPMEPDVPAEDR